MLKDMKRLIPNCHKSVFIENEISANSGCEMWLLQSTLRRISLPNIVPESMTRVKRPLLIRVPSLARFFDNLTEV